MIGYALAFFAGVAFVVVVLALLGANADPQGDEPGLSYRCDACDDAFRTVNAARQHAMTDHKAPDASAASHLIEEVIE